MKLEEIGATISDIADNQKDLQTIDSLFSYPVNPTGTRPLFVEIGGPCRHCKFVVLDAWEAQVLKVAVDTVLRRRVDVDVAALRDAGVQWED